MKSIRNITALIVLFVSGLPIYLIVDRYTPLTSFFYGQYMVGVLSFLVAIGLLKVLYDAIEED
jgi:putative copper export protein